MDRINLVPDKKRIVDNISFFAKEQNRKVGEIEEAIGVSQGYLSKLSKPSSKQMPSLETVCRLADLFGVSVNDLIFTDFPIFTKGDRQVHDFLETLIKQTADEETVWELVDYNEAVYNHKNGNDTSVAGKVFDLENGEFLETLIKQTADEETVWELVDYNEAVYNHKNGNDTSVAGKVFDLENGEEIFPIDFADCKQYLKQPLISDIFSGDKTYLLGDCYRKKLDDFNSIYVLQGIHISVETDELETLYLIILNHETTESLYGNYGDPDDRQCTQLMISEPSGSNNNPASVQVLYDTIRAHEGNYHLTPLAVDAISTYLHQVRADTNRKDNPSDSVEEQSLDPEELPF